MLRIRLLPGLPRTVVVLGLVSLLNDAASEMITPLLPVFLTAVLGAGPAVVGLVEGVAEATASVLKLLAGRMSDRGTGAKPLVLAGYGVSNLARPAIGLALSWPFILLLRFVDRIGKGLRTAPRDALIAGAVEPGLRGRAFGFHRAMDHAGAVVGPLAAFALLSAGTDLTHVFAWSIVPGIGVLLLIALGVPAGAPRVPVAAGAARFEWRSLDPRLKGMLSAAALLALASVPEVFVVLWARDAGLDVRWVPLLWAAASVAKMLVVMPAGAWSDRVGRVPVLVTGWLMRVVVLGWLALAEPGGAGVWLAFVAYSMSLAVTEAPERSLVGDLAPAAQKGTAYGWYHLVNGLFVLPGAVLFGLVWERWTSAAAFASAAIVTAVAAAMMVLASRHAPAADAS